MFQLDKITQKNKKIANCQAGMNYVELIVVLSIFSLLSSVVLFNYGEFQAKVDIKNLGSDIALKIIEAQKSSLSGQLPPLAQQGQVSSTWKPSYGIYFNPSSDNKSFIYFTDLDQNGSLFNPSCSAGGECLDKITITKNNYIERIDECDTPDCSPPNGRITDPLSITFKRPDSRALFHLNNVPLNLTGSKYVQITIRSPKEMTALIKIYSSGRVQVN